VGSALGAVAAIAAAGLLLVLAVPMPASRQSLQAGSLAAAIGDGLRLLWRVPLLRSTTTATTIRGALLGAIASERLLSRCSPRAVIVAATAGAGFSLAALAVMPGLGPAIPLAALAGIADGPVLAATLSVRLPMLQAGPGATTPSPAARGSV
jgi:hypothetical protein